MPTANPSSAGLRIFLFGNRGYMSAILPALLDQGANIVGLCTRVPQRQPSRLRRQAGRLLRWIGLRRRDDFSYTNPFGHLPEPAAIAQQHGIPVFASRMLRDREFADSLTRLAPDLILVAGFHRLIPAEVYTCARRAAVNLHPSLLPRHRGGTPSRWVIRHGERTTGITAHLMSEAFDTGDIVAQATVAVGPDDTWGDLETRMLRVVPGFAIDLVQMVASDSISPVPQPEADATSEPSFSGRHRFIDWTRPADDIRRTCLAIRPKSGGLAVVHGQTVCIWDVHPAGRDGTAPRSPGEILGTDGDARLLVACGDGTVAVSRILRFGRLLPARSLVRRLKLRAGDRFEPAPGDDRSP